MGSDLAIKCVSPTSSRNLSSTRFSNLDPGRQTEASSGKIPERGGDLWERCPISQPTSSLQSGTRNGLSRGDLLVKLLTRRRRRVAQLSQLDYLVTRTSGGAERNPMLTAGQSLAKDVFPGCFGRIVRSRICLTCSSDSRDGVCRASHELI